MSEPTTRAATSRPAAILQAIRDRDPEAAERAMAEHMHCASERLWSSLSTEERDEAEGA